MKTYWETTAGPVVPVGEKTGTERRAARRTESFLRDRTGQQAKRHQSRPLENPIYPRSVTPSEERKLNLPPKNGRILCI